MADETAKTPRWMWPVALVLTAVVWQGGNLALRFAPQPSPVIPSPAGPGGSLRSLVPEPEARAQLAAYYREWATAVADPKFPLTDTVQVSNALRFSANHFESTERLPPMQQLREPIARKVEYAIGKENRPIDDAARTELATVFGQISDDFGG